MRKFAVLADDATGANASAGFLATGLGCSVPVLDQWSETIDDTVAFNTRSREDASRSDLVTHWTKALWKKGYRDFDKRIDTTLRGPAPDELRRLCLALPEAPWIGVISACPSANRITRDGRQWIGERPITEVISVSTDDVGEYLFGSSAEILNVRRDQYRNPRLIPTLIQDPRPSVFDVVNEGDLVHVAWILRKLRHLYPGPIVTVSSGAILRYYPAALQRTIILVGSPTDTNTRQVKYLEQCPDTIIWPMDQPLDYHSTVPYIVVLHSGREPIHQRDRKSISAHLAHAAINRLAELCEMDWRPARLILTGGEMAQSFLDQIGATATQIIGLPAPLVAEGVIIGGIYENTEIITKGGMVGHDSLLWELAALPLVSRFKANYM